MKTKVRAICLLVLLTIVAFGFIATTQGAAGEGDWITKYRVEDPSTGEAMVEVNFETGTTQKIAPIFERAEVKVTITIDVDVTSPDTLLRLQTYLGPSAIEDVHWKRLNEYSLHQYNPYEDTVKFYQSAGQLVIELYGTTPKTTVPMEFTLVSLFGPTGQTLDHIKVDIVTVEMAEYQRAYIEKEQELQSLKDGGAHPGYIELYENILNQSQAEASQGIIDSALALLNTLSVSNVPVTATSYMEVLFFPAVGILAATTAIFGLMFIRGKGRLQYVLLVLEDQIRDLEGLTLRASRVDRTISTSLESVKDRLKSIVGM
jgi:hypothetical protein